MNDFAPTFLLAACPACSTVLSVERPFWRIARNTSAARGRSCYHVIGCAHAMEVFGGTKIHEEPELIQLVEEAWTRRAEELFEAKVERWGPSVVDAFRRELAGGVRPILPGTIAQLDFGPEDEAPSKEAPALRTVRDPSSGETADF